jgi:hypothetical protein
MKNVPGTTAASAWHYGQTIEKMSGQNPRKRTILQIPIVEFTGVVPRTANHWLNGGRMPVGVVLVKLRHFLELVGYTLEELVDLKTTEPLIYQLSEMIAYNIVTPQAAADALVFPHLDSILRMVHGGSSTSAERKEMLRELIEKNSERLSLARKTWEQRLELDRQGVDRVSAPVAPRTNVEAPTRTDEQPTAPVTKIAGSHNAGNTIEVIAPLLTALVKVTDHMITDEFGAENRKLLRGRTESGTMFALANNLRMLCSESARAQILADRQKP